jgi:hypothetical protein
MLKARDFGAQSNFINGNRTEEWMLRRVSLAVAGRQATMGL